MCEIEHFVDPADKKHPKFSKVADVVVTLFSACNQLDGKPSVKMTIGDAVAQGMVDNETLGYYIVCLYFLVILISIL